MAADSRAVLMGVGHSPLVRLASSVCIFLCKAQVLGVQAQVQDR